jgi:hypothetical protein
VEHTKDRRKSHGKPRGVYQLKGNHQFIMIVRGGLVAKRPLVLGTLADALLACMLHLSPQDQAVLFRYLLIDEIFEKCAVAFLRSSDAEIEVLLITEDVESVRRSYSNVLIPHSGRTRKVVAWTHSVAEMNEGLANGEGYFENLMRNPLILHDPKRVLERIKRK